MVDQRVGAWAFILGVIIAIIAGIVVTAIPTGITEWVALILVILGIVVGFLNIQDKQITGFLIAAIALMLTASAWQGLQPIFGLGTLLTNIVVYIATFVAPAALVVALKEVLNIAKSPAAV
ncbi:MAG: hypothetical protein JSW41_02285 [Candidatus Aenigmatarchaeota archaeon]|nr:MAG: hypothetical protein JSW41_02285 [Candidatus Aenigmarchaeota archaeon]